MRRVGFFLAFVSALPAVAICAAARAGITYLDVPGSAQPTPIAADGSGNLFIAANVVDLSGRQQLHKLASVDLGSSENDAISAAAVDPDGNLVLVGSTSSPDFPLISPLISKTSGTSAFIIQFDSGLHNVLFSTLLGGTHGGGTSGPALALDANGNIYLTGSTEDTDFPVPASTFVTGIQVQAMMLGSSANVIIGGSTSGGPLPVGAVQAAFPGTGIAGFVTKLDSNAHKILFSTYFGGGIGLEVTGIVLDTGGTIWLTGSSSPEDLPVLKGNPLLGPDYVASLAPDGSAVTNMFTTPEGGAGRAILNSAAGTIIAQGGADSLLTVSTGAGPSLLAITNSAGSDTASALAPDELISIYGIGLGPSTPASAQIVNGDAPLSLNGVQILFDGEAAPLLYVGPNQINAIVPQEVFGRKTTALQIVTPSGTISGTDVPIRPSQPEVFLSNLPSQDTTPAAAAVNQDGTLNSAANPAALGSVVSVWVSGAGLVGLPVTVLQLIRTADQQVGYSLEVLFAGQAPELVDGVMQVNFRLPSADVASEFQLQIGDVLSDPFVLYTRP